MQIDGKLAVVTGAAVGIGRAIAQRLAAEGAEVVLADIDEEGGRQSQELIGPTARFVAVDMRDDEAVAELLACHPQILVNNAGGGAGQPPSTSICGRRCSPLSSPSTGCSMPVAAPSSI